MKCEKCGYENSEFDILCENCGTLLNIENNLLLQEKYNNKPRAIDIEHIKIDQSEKVFDRTRKKVRLTLAVFILLLLISVGLFSYNTYQNARTNDIMNKYNDFKKTTQLGVVYVGKDNSVNSKLEDYVANYEINYIYISTNKLSKVKKNKIKKDLDISKIDSSIIIIKNGKAVDYLTDISEEKNIDIFLKNNGIIPKEEGDSKNVISKFDLAITSEESTIIYIANNKNESNEKNNKKIEQICNDYSINYVFVEGYYLTDNQKLRLLKKINYNEIHDELVILVDEGEVKEVTEFVSSSEKDYFELFLRYGIIDVESAESLKNVNLKKVKDIISKKEKQIVMIGSKDCIYCDKLKPIIGKIGIQNNKEVYYFEVNDDNQIEFEEYLKKIGYKEEKITTPIIVITENNQIIDCIIGLSEKDYYIDKLKELGVIR